MPFRTYTKPYEKLVGSYAHTSNPVILSSAIASIDTTGYTITTTNPHGLATNTPVSFVPDLNAGSGDIPTGLFWARTYWTYNVTSTTFQLVASSGGTTPVAITGAGTLLRYHIESLSTKQIKFNNLNLSAVKTVVYPYTSGVSNAAETIYWGIADYSEQMATSGSSAVASAFGGYVEAYFRAYGNQSIAFIRGNYGGYPVNSNNFTQGFDNSGASKILQKSSTFTTYPSIAVGVGFNGNPYFLNNFKVKVYDIGGV